jgi:ASC-1-like (ASCH) protein
MKIHEMKLLKEPYLEIKEGRKIIEMRLYDEKRQGISVGDTIVFACGDFFGEKLEAEVVGIYIYEDFFSLAESYEPRALGFDGSSSEYIAEFMMRIYSAEDVKKYGVCAILIEVIK